MIRVRFAQREEANALTSLCLRSKAHWGYDADFLLQAAPALAITETMIGGGLVLLAEDHDNNLLGVAAVEAMAVGKFDLSRLFVEPSVIRSGIGLSDPFAVAFYEHLGATKLGDAPSDAIPGRGLPLLEYRIPSV